MENNETPLFELPQEKIEPLNFNDDTIILEEIVQIDEFKKGVITKPLELNIFLGFKEMKDIHVKSLIDSMEKKEQHITQLSINVMKNEITPDGFTSLANSILKFTNLTSLILDFRSNKLGKSYEVWLKNIASLTGLKQLSLFIEDTDCTKELIYQTISQN